MAKTVTALDLTVKHALPGVPFGNLTVLPYTATFLAGVLTSSDTATAVVHTDTIVIGTIPKGFEVYQAFIRSTAALGAATSTISVGFSYVDGVDVPAYPENNDEWIAAQVNTAVFNAIGNTGFTPKVFSKDAYLEILVNTAALATTGGLTGSYIVTLFGVLGQD